MPSADPRLADVARYNEVTADLGRVALLTVGIPELFDEGCRAAAGALGGCTIRLLEATESTLVIRGLCGVELDAADATVHDEAVWQIFRDQTPRTVSRVESSRWRSSITVPLSGQPFVIQAVAVEEARFADAEELFLRTVANLLAAAMARIRYESELIEARQDMKSLVDHSPDLIVRFDRDLRIVYVNPAVVRATRLQPEFFLGRRMWELKSDYPWSIDDWREPLQRVLTEGIDQEFEARGPVTGREFNVRSVPELAADGSVAHVLAVCRDTTEKRRAEEDRRRLELQLEQATRLASLGRLAATIAHEFNNVLMAIQPFADLLQRSAEGSGDSLVGRAAKHIAQAVQRGRRITQEMLRYTRAVEPVREAVDLGELLSYVCGGMKLVVAERMTISLELPPQPIFLYADRAQLEQVFTNLIANARDAVEPGGSLVISAEVAPPGATYPFGVIPHVENFVHVTFRDDGSGIPPQVMAHTFEPLFTSKRGGTGVGLAVAQQVVSMHGGHVFVESQQGSGTAFHLFLPLSHQAPQGGDAPQSARGDVRLLRIALVEDEASIAEGLSAVLESEGFEVAHVETGGAAVGLIERFDPELVLLDVGLPDIDGLEVYRRIHERWPELAVIFSTGHGDRRKVEEVARTRNVGFLMKPYEIEELFAAIADLETRR